MAKLIGFVGLAQKDVGFNSAMEFELVEEHFASIQGPIMYKFVGARGEKVIPTLHVATQGLQRQIHLNTCHLKQLAAPATISFRGTELLR